MILTILGTRAAIPAPGDPSPGYLVSADDSTVLLDCGPGVSGAVSAAVDPLELDAVIVSHLHSDHCYDLLPLGKLLVHRRRAAASTSRVRLYIPCGGYETLRKLNQLFPVGGVDPSLDRVFDEAFDVIEVDGPSTVDLPALTCHLEPVDHVVTCSAVRLETAGKSVVYSADTGWCEAIIRLAAGADTFLCEATLRESDATGHGHLSAAEAGAIASLAGVGHLVLTHFTRTDRQWLDGLIDEAAAAFAGPITVARPGAQISIGDAAQQPTVHRTPTKEL